MTASAATMVASYQQLAADGSNVAADGTIFTSVSYGGSVSDPRVIGGVDWNSLIGGVDQTPGWANPSFNFINDRNSASSFYSGSPALKATTDDIIYNSTMTLGINGLTIGQAYRAQFISYDAVQYSVGNQDAANRTQMLSFSNSADTLLFQQFLNDSASQSSVGAALVTVEWVADDSWIGFTFAATGTNDNAILNAFVIQQIPESSSVALGLLGTVVFLRRRRS